MSRTVTHILFLLAFSYMVKAQNENSQWRFGLGAGLDFTSGSPNPVPASAISSQEAGSSIADATGLLLFYTDGITVWDQNNLIMANGTGLNGNTSSTQGALIIKKPNSSTEYYIFTTGQNGPLCYSIVDISLSAGAGSVTVKNVTLTSNSSEKLTATTHCNGVDYWIVGHEKTTNKFVSYLLSSSGVNPTAVNSLVGSSYAASSSGQGQLKFSPSGHKLAAALFDLNAVELFNFDKSNGNVSYILSLTNLLVYNYGVEFSPDGTKLYTSLSSGSNAIYQWDLCAGTNNSIANSQFLVTNSGTTKSGMMLAPDGQIYVARSSQQDIAAITNPDAAGVACGYAENAQVILPGTSTACLPNHIKFYTPTLPTSSTFSWTAGNTPACYTASFSAQISNSGPYCTFAPAYSVASVQWNFGDPSSGSANFSGLQNPQHVFSALGTYTVQLVVNYSCGGGSDTVFQLVNINQACFSVVSNSVSCSAAGSATITPLGGSGVFSYTWLPAGQIGPIATDIVPGSYTVIAYDQITNQSSSYTVAFASPVPFTASVVSGGINCYGAITGTASAYLSGGSNFQVYDWTNGSQTYTLTDPISMSAGIWNLTVTDLITSCTLNTSFVLSQPPALTVVAIASIPSVCVGGAVPLSAQVSGGTPAYTYTWLGGPENAGYSPSPVTVGNFVYSLFATDINNCVATTTVAITAVANPVLAANSATVCPSQSATLSVIGAASYSWNGTGGTNSITANPIVTTQYTITGTTAGCSATLASQIAVKPVPIFTISNNTSQCTGTSFTAEAAPGDLFNWQGPAGFASSSPSISINALTANMAGLYQVTLTAANNCTASATTSLTVFALPTATVSGQTVCAGQSISITCLSSASDFVWLGPQSFSAGVQNPVIAIADFESAGAYTVMVTSMNNCTAIASGQVNVIPPPDLNITLSSASLCAQALNGSPNTITLTSTGAASYTLSTPNHIYNPNPSGPESPVSMAPPYQPAGPATATLYGTNGVCTASITSIFTIVPNPILSVINPTPTICAGGSYTYTIDGANTYTWSTATPGNTAYTTGGVLVTNPSINSLFSVIGGSLGCNSAAQTSSITVNPIPNLMLASQPVTVCINSNTVLSASGSGTLHTWSPSLWLNSGGGAMVTCSPLADQVYTVVSSLSSCTTTATMTVIVKPLPTAAISATQTSMCVNGSLTLSGNGGLNYYWRGPTGFQSATQELHLLGSSTSHNGVYTLTVKDQYGCKAKATQAITVHPLPVGAVNGKMTGCTPFDLQPSFKINPSSAATVSCLWNYSGHDYTGACPAIHITSAGTYPVFATVTDLNGCVRTFSALITGRPQPEAQFTFSPDKAIEDIDDVYFSDASSGAVSYSWLFGDDSHTSTLRDPMFRFHEPGTYPVQLIIKDQYQCSDTIAKTVEVIADASIYLPNAFTPNNDGHNDVFGPVSYGPLQYTLIIIDRWGAELYHGSGENAAWDGNYRGEACKEDSYVWILETRGKQLGLFGKKMTGRVLLYR